LQADCTPHQVRSAAEMERVVLENKFAVAFMTTPLGRTDRRQRLVDIVR